jgi:hypothetical protein
MRCLTSPSTVLVLLLPLVNVVVIGIRPVFASSKEAPRWGQTTFTRLSQLLDGGEGGSAGLTRVTGCELYVLLHSSSDHSHG